MPNTPKTTVVFLAFANAVEQAYLQQLKKESAALRDLFLPLDQKNAIKLLREESLEIKELPQLLQQYKDRISIFHYGGHADGQQLLLEDGEGQVAGLADLLSLQKGLKLVFLNGCSTQAQAMPYLEAGVPVVLATNQSIPDQEASSFAYHFYHALLNQSSIRDAYTAASGALKSQSADYNALNSEITIHRGLLSRKNTTRELPWQLHVLEGQEALLDWSLSKQIVAEAAQSAAEKKQEKKRSKWLFFLLLPLLAIVLAFLYNQYQKTQQPLMLSVNLQNKSINQSLPFEGGALILQYGGQPDTIKITKIEEVLFRDIPANFRGDKVQLSFQAKGFEAIDTSFEITTPAINLSINRDDTYALLAGTVIDADSEAPIEGVAITVQGITAYSNAQGHFEIQIPAENQQVEQKISYSKIGYQAFTRNSEPVIKGHQLSMPLQKIQ